MINPVISRRRVFSTAHFYHQAKLSEAQNREVFGACFTPYGHGHNYTLEIYVEGPIDPQNGLVVNVNDLDAIMKTVLQPFDHRHISFEHPVFKTEIPTTENMSAHLYQQVASELRKVLPKLSLNRVRLFETDDLWATARGHEKAPKSNGSFQVTQEITLRSMHHLQNEAWNETENRDFYGICYGQHGHDYRVQVSVQAEMDERTGLATDRDNLNKILEDELTSKYDGVNLNTRFKNTSCEQLAVEFYQILKPRLPGLLKVGIQETRKNYFEFPPDAGF